jgi:tripartite-type tricarboxylate transporter receptor subunit TctC
MTLVADMEDVEKNMRLRFVASLVVAFALVTGSMCMRSHAQDFPNATIRIVVPSAAGGPLDIVARAVGDRLAQRFNHPVIIENRAGAGGNFGALYVSKAAPDGYTLLLCLGTTLTINPSIYKGLEFDLKPVSILTSASQMLVVNPKIPVTNVAEFVTWAKKNQPILYGHSGNGSPSHLVMEYLRMRAGFTTTPVPYGGSAPLIVDLIGGQFNVAFGATVGLVPLVAAGQLRALAVSSEERSKLAPDVPTVAESGFPGFRLENDFILLAPGRTPSAVTDLLERAVQDELKNNAVREMLQRQDIRVVGSTGAIAAERIKNDTALWAGIIKEIGLQSQ